MPPRISRPSIGAPKPKTAKARSRKRALNAFTIASAEIPEDVRIRPDRLGDSEDGPQRKKRRLPSEVLFEDEDGEGEGPSIKARPSSKGPVADVSEDSDSDGNRWRVGHVDADDDSDIDSEEAFDSEDEERFAHFSFSGSKKDPKPSITRTRDSRRSMDLEEAESGADDSDDDSLGEDAMDLAQMLDDYSEDSDKERLSHGEDNDGGSSSGEESGGIYSNSSFSDAEDVDQNQMSKLQSLVAALHPEKDVGKKRTAELYDSTVPSIAGPTSNEKFDVRDLFNSSDPQLVKMTKKLGNLPKQPKNDPKLAPSLPKRQQDRLDRIAANEKANETLERWVDSVKHMRKAEHLLFPLQDPEAEQPRGTEHLLPSISTKPLTSLESTVKSILQESGLAPEDDHDSGDELPENGVTVQEVLARRAELRRARELLFREEKKAKRIKKIKSKSYRRVHRKERERLAALEADSEMDDEERDAHDRRRAEERMGAKHRDSKWAKQMKKSGRSIWDDEARSGVTEMARRNEELRKRIAGKMDDNGSDDETASSSDEVGDDEDENGAQQRRFKRSLDKLVNEDGSDSKVYQLSSMKFMQRAEEARRAHNDNAILKMRRDIDGDTASEKSGDENVGRKLFGPSEQAVKGETREERNEFEEPEFSEEDDLKENSGVLVDPTEQNKPANPRASYGQTLKTPPVTTLCNAPLPKAKSTQPKAAKPKTVSSPDADGWMTVGYNRSSDEDNEEDEKESLVSQTDILKRAFAGDDVEDEFEKEKQGVIADEDEKMIDNTMPGWGSWVGEGISKRELKRAKGKVLSKQEGIKPENRKDMKLKNVIINQKRVRQNVDYLASTLPFPFTSRAEYERSIRMPIGTEWNVKRTYQENTKPRILVKAGTIVAPMEKPLI